MKNVNLVFRAFLVAICLASLIIAIVPSFRDSIRGWVTPPQRSVISTIRNDLFRDGRVIIIAKVKNDNWLYIEVYEQLVDGYRRLIDKIKLPDSNDGFFHFRGQATNLAVEDLDNDGKPEILAPTYDANHVAHLNIYKYNPLSNKFEKYSEKPK